MEEEKVHTLYNSESKPKSSSESITITSAAKSGPELHVVCFFPSFSATPSFSTGYDKNDDAYAKETLPLPRPASGVFITGVS